MQNCVPQERIPWVPNSRKRRKTKLSIKSDALAEKHGAWREMSISSQKEETDTFYSPAEARVMPAPSSTNPEEREFVIDSGAYIHMLSK